MAFEPEWGEYLRLFETHSFSDIPQDTEKHCVIVEPRCHPLLIPVLRNFMSLLQAKRWGLIVFHGTKNEGFLKENLIGWAGHRLINLDLENLTIEQYNRLLKSETFWSMLQRYGCRHALIFQTDTLLLRDGLDDFLEFDYIGAPWKSRWFGLDIGNGGLSLRRVEVMLEIVRTRPSEVVIQNQKILLFNEDGYFGFWCLFEGRKLPSVEQAKSFSVETLWHPDPVGMHQPHMDVRPILRWHMMRRSVLPLTVAPVVVPLQLWDKGGFPQSARPWISSDIWCELVDQQQSFFLRSHDEGFPSPGLLSRWLDQHPYEKVVLVMNNQHDISLPGPLASEDVMKHPKLVCILTTNPDRIHPKIYPIPIGLKWQFESRQLYGEDKDRMRGLHGAVSNGADETRALFYAPRSVQVWVRPMTTSNRETIFYQKTNTALRTPRDEIWAILEKNCIHAVKTDTFLSPLDYFTRLKQFRFVVSPAGNGLDSHSTWEALLAGCIPIVPRSTLDPLYDDLPVWLVSDWAEITTESVIEATNRFQKHQDWNFEKIFADWWQRWIHELTIGDI